MLTNKINIELQILSLYKPVADAAQESVDKIAEQLKEINSETYKSSDQQWKTFRDKIYDHLNYISEIKTNYEDYKRQFISEIIESENKTSLIENMQIELEQKANVIFVRSKSGQKKLL